jgi:hypothetical protein
MRTLELFAGTQSFSKAVLRQDCSNVAITVDILPKFGPTIVADILTWDYHVYEPHSFDVIWCSPPCTEYSVAKTRGARNLELADRLVARCFEIIDYLKPRVWIVENVGTGLLVNRMEAIRPGLKSFFVDYCVYGKPYRKRTILWSNLDLSLRLCTGKGSCPQMDGPRHKGSCGNNTSTYNAAKVMSVWEKDAIPDALVDSLVEQILASE